MEELKTTNMIVQQSLSRLLGYVSYDAHEHGIHAALSCLLGLVTKDVSFRRLRVDYVDKRSLEQVVLHSRGSKEELV